MTKKKVIIATDSRGKGLEQFLQTKFPSSQLHLRVDAISGATIQYLIEHIERNQDSTGNLSIISGGICNLTKKKRGKGAKILTYTRSEENILLLKDLITITTGKHQSKLIFTTIPPVSLHRYFKHFNDNKDPPAFLNNQQKDLLQDIDEINQLIITLNKSANLQTIDLHNKCFNTALDRKKPRTANPARRSSSGGVILRRSACEQHTPEKVV